MGVCRYVSSIEAHRSSIRVAVGSPAAHRASVFLTTPPSLRRAHVGRWPSRRWRGHPEPFAVYTQRTWCEDKACGTVRNYYRERSALWSLGCVPDENLLGVGRLGISWCGRFAIMIRGLVLKTVSMSGGEACSTTAFQQDCICLMFSEVAGLLVNDLLAAELV